MPHDIIWCLDNNIFCFNIRVTQRVIISVNGLHYFPWLSFRSLTNVLKASLILFILFTFFRIYLLINKDLYLKARSFKMIRSSQSMVSLKIYTFHTSKCSSYMYNYYFSWQLKVLVNHIFVFVDMQASAYHVLFRTCQKWKEITVNLLKR